MDEFGKGITRFNERPVIKGFSHTSFHEMKNPEAYSAWRREQVVASCVKPLHSECTEDGKEIDNWKNLQNWGQFLEDRRYQDILWERSFPAKRAGVRRTCGKSESPWFGMQLKWLGWSWQAWVCSVLPVIFPLHFPCKSHFPALQLSSQFFLGTLWYFYMFLRKWCPSWTQQSSRRVSSCISYDIPTDRS